MIFDFIFLILTLLASVSYLKNSYSAFLLLLFTILTNVWGICPTGSIKVYDWIFIVTILTILIGRSKCSHFWKVKTDPLGKVILYLFAYVVLAALISPIRGVESLQYSLMVARFDTFYLLYFVFRVLPLESIRKVLKPAIYLTLLNGVLYYLQYAGIFLMANSESMTDLEEARFNNIPVLTLALFYFFFLYKRNGKIKIFSLLFFGGILVGSQNRALILGVAVSVVIYIVLNYRKKLVERKTLIALILVGFLSSGVLAYRFSQKGSTGQGITSELELAYVMYSTGSYRLYDNQMVNNEGTLAFRFAMIFEKVDYLCQHPLSLIIGSGSYHEKSIATKKLPFVLGSKTEDGIAKIDTDDVALLSRLFRYGLLFIALYVFLIAKTLKMSYNNYNIASQIYFMILVCYIVWAICGDVFHRPQNFIPALCLMPYILKKSFYEKNRRILNA